MSELFTEVEFHQQQKQGEHTPGDNFMVQRDPECSRLLAVLSDGLGSGVKANILSNMTARMAIKFAETETDVVHFAKVIMNALPVCKVRKIAYATFTILDHKPDGSVQIIEQGNPPFVLLRNQHPHSVPHSEFPSTMNDHRSLRVSRFTPRSEDRIVLFSDGVTEAGMGSRLFPLGWRRSGCADFLSRLLKSRPGISARDLARSVVGEASRKEPGFKPCDDITCGTVYFRTPRRTLLASGPPFCKTRDADFARIIRTFDGTRIICGGTSADIFARETGATITTDLLRFRRSNLPPVSRVEGADLVTEGILTLTETLNLLTGKSRSAPSANPAAVLQQKLLDSDVVHLLVGTRINQAHQDPCLPMELEIRRSLLRRLATVLEQDYFKRVNLEFI